MLDNLRRSSTPPQDLFGIIAHVRNRWRMKLALRGAVYVLGVAFAIFLLAAYGMESVKFTAASIIVSRILRDVVENYDFDGLELDWSRWPLCCEPDEAAQVADVITA